MTKTIFAILTETGRKPTVFGREYIPDPENPKRSRKSKGKKTKWRCCFTRRPYKCFQTYRQIFYTYFDIVIIDTSSLLHSLQRPGRPTHVITKARRRYQFQNSCVNFPSNFKQLIPLESHNILKTTMSE